MDAKRTKSETITVAVVERGSGPRCALCMDADEKLIPSTPFLRSTG